ncbi:Transposase DDE domain protein [Symmachiella dynata]|uniref:Transposase DDE domain protein n=1 Tax=Symmachiella dynata TaxID=2527995 RepID=A0A517ZRX6_9PLAN|nr:ISAs1 family transposase [Symmachiella dynata]QDU45228.1 Transposase DDE domain protein [Symmachiella dynata]
MRKTQSVRIQDNFTELIDPRRREVTYPLINIVVIALCGVICGADDFVAIAKFGRTKRDWLAKFLDLSAGIPSHDRFNAVLAMIKPAQFEQCLLSWITALHDITDGQVVAIDGKTLRRSFDTASSKSAIHMVSAWATANQISLGQVVVDSKSNEITAIPKLLQILEISGSLVTIDAMGCQTEIAKEIVAQGADYCLAVKGNQPALYNGIVAFYNDHLSDDFARTQARRHRTTETGHGREEIRDYIICPVPEGLPDRARWPGLKAIGIAMSNTLRDGKECYEARYYILSRYLSAKRFAAAGRSHWGVENQLHWQLDVTFREDECRIRKGHADANYSILRRTALGLLKQESTAKVGIKNKRLTAGWDESYLEKVLLGT